MILSRRASARFHNSATESGVTARWVWGQQLSPGLIQSVLHVPMKSAELQFFRGVLRVMTQ